MSGMQLLAMKLSAWRDDLARIIHEGVDFGACVCRADRTDANSMGSEA